MNTRTLSRRRMLALAAAGLAFPLGGLPLAAAPRPIAMRPVPSTGEAIPVLGIGTWITFNVGSSSRLRDEQIKVLQAFFDHGGHMVDSSPMYGSAGDVMGYCLKRVRDLSPLFSATKIWTSSNAECEVQMQDSERLWGESQFDLQQVYNLLNWEFHLARLKEWNASGRIRYLGITTSHARRHSDFAGVMQAEPLDFVQLTYNILDRGVEDRLLPLAADRGQAVIVNQPFQRGGLFQSFGHHPLPKWASEFGARNWAQFFLKLVLSHPAVTCAIPATSQVSNMEEKMAAARGPMPDAAMRRHMIDYVERL